MDETILATILVYAAFSGCSLISANSHIRHVGMTRILSASSFMKLLSNLGSPHTMSSSSEKSAESMKCCASLWEDTTTKNRPLTFVRRKEVRCGESSEIMYMTPCCRKTWVERLLLSFLCTKRF